MIIWGDFSFYFVPFLFFQVIQEKIVNNFTCLRNDRGRVEGKCRRGGVVGCRGVGVTAPSPRSVSSESSQSPRMVVKCENHSWPLRCAAWRQLPRIGAFRGGGALGASGPETRVPGHCKGPLRGGWASGW